MGEGEILQDHCLPTGSMSQGYICVSGSWPLFVPLWALCGACDRYTGEKPLTLRPRVRK